MDVDDQAPAQKDGGWEAGAAGAAMDTAEGAGFGAYALWCK